MANSPQPATPASNLIDVLKAYSGSAWQAYTDSVIEAHAKVDPNLDDDKKKDRAKEIQQAQAQNAAAFSQVVTAARIGSEQEGRDGYLAVVQLMRTTAVTADKVCTKLLKVLHADPDDGTVPQTADVAVINAFVGVLHALAELSPDTVWETPATPTNQ